MNHILKKYALTEAEKAVSENSFGVGGLLIDLQNKEIIHRMHNTVIAKENDTEKSRLKDPTAHGERQLVDWYYANKEELKLPEPKDILIMTTLDPCCMCTGSILTAGFKVIIAALDNQAGINWNNSNTFNPFEGTESIQIKESFIYPKVNTGVTSRLSYGEIPQCFVGKSFSSVDDCLNWFNKGASLVNEVVNEDTFKLKDCLNIRTLKSTSPIIKALKLAYPDALKYHSPSPGVPDEGLAPYLISAAKDDIANGGNGDAVAFLDCFGNLLMCKGGQKKLSPIRTAYMETIRAYQKVRYDLTPYNNDALRYLSEPKYGTFIFVKGFNKGTQSFADMGAYGSTIFGTMENKLNLQYITPQINGAELDKFIKGMPPLYCNLIKPMQVKNSKLVQLVEKALRQ